MENQLLRLGESTRTAGADRIRRNDSVSVSGERGHGGEEEEEITENLEEEVKEMAEKLKKYRSTLPVQLKATLSSILASQRPLFSLSSDQGGSQPDPSGGPHQGAGLSLCNSNSALPADDVELLRDKISSNISAMPIILKRMNDCISRIDKLVSSNEAIHPAFKRKKS